MLEGVLGQVRVGCVTRWCGGGGNQSSYTVVEAVGPSLTSQLGRTSTSSPAAMCSRFCWILVGRTIGTFGGIARQSPNPAVAPGFSYMIRSCWEDLALRHPPYQPDTIHLPAEIEPVRDKLSDPRCLTTFRTRYTVLMQEHRVAEWGAAVGSWRVEKEKKAKEKQPRHMHWRWA